MYYPKIPVCVKVGGLYQTHGTGNTFSKMFSGCSRFGKAGGIGFSAKVPRQWALLVRQPEYRYQQPDPLRLNDGEEESL